MRLPLLSLAALALFAAGCGGGKEGVATPETVGGSAAIGATPSEDDLPALLLQGDATAGKAIFANSGCGGCHVLDAAGATGTIGPNLDAAQPSYEFAVTRITKGYPGGAMPSFEDQLAPQQIADVAQYVAESVGR